MKLTVVSGYSGSGKSTALNVLEDGGYYCIDNLPLNLLKDFALQGLNSERPVELLAVGIDARNLSNDLSSFPQIIEQIRDCGVVCEVVFLETSVHVLQKRFSETRRKHPLSSKDISLLEAVTLEREILAGVRELADIYLDTSNTNVRELSAIINERVVSRSDAELSLLLMSFGFKHGAPSDVDFIFDVRCLPNPHWEPKLRTLTGKDELVAEYLAEQQSVKQMLSDIEGFLTRWLPHFEAENRSYLTVAIGCTGGQHRSVYLAEALAHDIGQTRDKVTVRHRDIA